MQRTNADKEGGEGGGVIQDEEIERALDWLVRESKSAAQARANRVYMEEYRKALKAKLMKSCGQESIGAQEREAYAHPDYLTHLEALREAVEQDELYRWRMTAAEARISAWQTQSRMARAADKVT